jgi:hypothetical protein
MINRPLQFGLALALAALAALPAQAASLFNTGTPTGSVLAANSIDASDWIAESFTVTGPTQIGSIFTYVQSTSDSADNGLPFTVALYNSTGPSGAPVPAINWNATNQGQLDQFSATYTTGGGWIGQSGLNWVLGAGTYFVAIETDGNGVQGLVTPTGVATLPRAVAFYSGGAGYVSDPAVASDAFGLQVASVPEPHAAGLMLLGLGAIGCLWRRRRA